MRMGPRSTMFKVRIKMENLREVVSTLVTEVKLSISKDGEGQILARLVMLV